MGVCRRGSPAQAGDSLTGARDVAHKGRELLRQGLDPIDHREQQRETGRQAEDVKKADKARERWTLARWARDYHERVIEPTRTTKHAAQWISSLENHIPARLWHKPIAEIDAPELLQALADIKPHERARNLSQGDRVAATMQRIRQRLDAVFEDAIFHKRCTHTVHLTRRSTSCIARSAAMSTKRPYLSNVNVILSGCTVYLKDCTRSRVLPIPDFEIFL